MTPRSEPRQPKGKAAPHAAAERGQAPATQRDTVFHKEFREDLLYWVETDRKIAIRAFTMIEAIVRDPFKGIGKPEPLSYVLANTWSRRLTDVDRIVHVVSDERIDFLQARYHY